MYKSGVRMNKLIIIVLSVFLWIGCDDLTNTAIQIPTAQCGMCAMNIEKALGNVKGVKNAYVDMDQLVAKVSYDENVTKVSVLETAISSAGYQANETLADMVAYKNLPACCKLPKDQ